MAKMMRKHGETTSIHYDEFLLQENPSAYEILEVQPEAELVAPKPVKKAKPVIAEDDLNTAFNLDVL